MKMKTLNFNGQTFDVNDDGATRYDESQSLTDDEKAKARENIGAAAAGEGGAGGTGTVGPQGPQGEPGEDGASVTVTNVSESTEDGGSNIVTFSDGNTLTVKNGSKGSPGEKGDKGDTGAQGPQGIQGEPGENAESVPSYIQAAAQLVARTINLRQSNNSFAFAFLSDGHCGYYSDIGNDAVKHAGQALQVINRRAPLDCIVHGGDLSTGAWNSTCDSTFTDVENFTELLCAASMNTPVIWCPGNHDDAPYQATAERVSAVQTYALFGRKNLRSGAVGDFGCNYGYLDFESQKLRMIYLDADDKRTRGTVGVGSGETAPDYLNAHNIGWQQLKWLAEVALDFTEKESPEQWGIIVVSHVALNVSGTTTDAVSGESYAYSTANAGIILGAYRKGQSGSVTHEGNTITYDYSTLPSRPEIYCLVHGHNHAYLEAYIEGVLSIGCPNAMNGRERESSDGNTYAKTAGTAEGTAFCVITVDRQNNLIYADHYGAGFDRQWEFVPIGEYTYTNQLPIATDGNGNVYNGIGYKSGVYLSSGAETTTAGYYTTGYIPAALGDFFCCKDVTMAIDTDKHRLCFYSDDHSHLDTVKTTIGDEYKSKYFEFDENGIVIKIKVPNDDKLATTKYIRFCCSGITADSVVTRNEEIV